MTNKTPSNLWKPGQSGNPAGRPPGQSAITRLRAQLEPDAPEILQTMVAAAKGGDVQAARLILERILPPVKATEQMVGLQMPEGGTLTAQGRSVLFAVASGQLAPGQGALLLSAIGSLARVIEINEMEARLTILEERQHATS